MAKKTEDKADKALTKVVKQVEVMPDKIVMPAVSTKEALDAWKQYQDLKAKIVDREVDIQIIEKKEFLKKSYWRKIATFFNLSVEVVDEKWEQVGKTIVWHFTCKAIAPNGRFAIGAGSCDAYEKATIGKDGYYVKFDKWKKQWSKAQPNSIHNVRSTAETRAFNRAVSNLVGGGEVSAEEVQAETSQGPITRPVVQTPRPVVKPAPAAPTQANQPILASDGQRKMIFVLLRRFAERTGKDYEYLRTVIKRMIKVESFTEMSKEQATYVIDYLTEKGAQWDKAHPKSDNDLVKDAEDIFGAKAEPADPKPKEVEDQLNF